MTQLWDPLWEYVLEDYDHVDEKARRRSSRSQRNSYSSKSGSRGTKTSRASYSRDNEEPKKTQAEVSESNGILSMSTWTFFDMNGGGSNSNNFGDRRDDESEQQESQQDAWNVERKEGTDGTKKKGILRRSESRSSTAGLSQTSSKSSLSKSKRRSIKSNGRSFGSSFDQEDVAISTASKSTSKSTGLRSSMKKSRSDSSRNISLKQNKSETSNKSNEQSEHRDELNSESPGFGDIWDVLTGSPPVTNTPRKVPSSRPSEAVKMASPSIASNGRNKIFALSLRKSNSESSGTALKERDSKEKPASKGRTRSRVKEQRRTSLFRRRRSKAMETTKDTSSRTVTFDENLESTKEIALNDVAEEERTKEEANKRTSSFAEFDPMMLLFEVAGKLDPWGFETSVDDSNSETTASETTGLNDETSDISHSDIGQTTSNRQNAKKVASLLDQPLPDPSEFGPRCTYHPHQSRTPQPAYSTEIRLKVNTIGDTVSEEVYRVMPAEEESEPDMDNSQLWGTNATPSVHSSVDDTPETMISVLDMSKPRQSFSESSKRSEISEELVERETSLQAKGSELAFSDSVVKDERPPGELGVPRDLHIRKDEDSFFHDIDEGFPGPEGKGLWKAACCNVGKKIGKSNDMVNRLKREDAAAVFPTTRLISNGKSRSITGQKADHVNGVMGVPSDHFEESKGPQSLYAYDYGSSEHMDVSYKEVGQKPRSCIAVRSLGAPPSLSQSDLEEGVVVQIEASTVSETDCLLRKGKWWGRGQPPLPTTPGSDMVGKVYRIKKSTEEQYELHPRQTVVSLTKWGGNSRYMKIHPSQVVKVPDGLDPAEVACLPNTYLAAFQCLHMGQTGSRRYRDNSLKGKSVLIIGCMSNNMGKAIIELALCAGVANIYATCKKKHWKTLISYGVLPLSQDPYDWIQRIEGTIDLILAPNGNLREDVTPVHFRALLPKQGQLVLCGHRPVGNDIPINDWKKDQFPISCGKNKALANILNKSHAYDVYESWDRKLELCKKDLSHLLLLLERGDLKPEVLDRLPLSKVAKAHDLLESKRLPGFLICEPWMRGKKRAVYL